MTDKVVDASALAAVVFDELDRESVERRLTDCRLFAPRILDFEMASVCLKKIRFRPSEETRLLLSFEKFHLVPIIRSDIDHAKAIKLAIETKLSIYDATYLWLAYELGVELVTLDEKLQKAAKKLKPKARS